MVFRFQVVSVLNDIGVKNVVKLRWFNHHNQYEINEVVCSEKLYEFDLNQHKDTFDDGLLRSKASG